MERTRKSSKQPAPRRTVGRNSNSRRTRPGFLKCLCLFSSVATSIGRNWLDVTSVNRVFTRLTTRRRYESWFLRFGLADNSGAWWFALSPGESRPQRLSSLQGICEASFTDRSAEIQSGVFGSARSRSCERAIIPRKRSALYGSTCHLPQERACTISYVLGLVRTG